MTIIYSKISHRSIHPMLLLILTFFAISQIGCATLSVLAFQQLDNIAGPFTYEESVTSKKGPITETNDQISLIYAQPQETTIEENTQIDHIRVEQNVEVIPEIIPEQIPEIIGEAQPIQDNYLHGPTYGTSPLHLDCQHFEKGEYRNRIITEESYRWLFGIFVAFPFGSLGTLFTTFYLLELAENYMSEQNKQRLDELIPFITLFGILPYIFFDSLIAILTSGNRTITKRQEMIASPWQEQSNQCPKSQILYQNQKYLFDNFGNINENDEAYLVEQMVLHGGTFSLIRNNFSQNIIISQSTRCFLAIDRQLPFPEKCSNNRYRYPDTVTVK